jgi:GT2 family glycosyltransferase
MRQNFIPVTACVRTRAFRTVGGFDETARFEDHDLWKRMHTAGYRFLYAPVIAWTYRRQPKSRTELE